MKIVEINGGLGNQICQYAFLRWLEVECGHSNVMFDDTFFFLAKQHNGFELDRVFKNCRLKFFRNNVSKDVWLNIMRILLVEINKKLPNILLDNDIDLSLVADNYWYDENSNLKHNFTFDGPTFLVDFTTFSQQENTVLQQVKKIDNVYYMGVWKAPFYGLAIKKRIRT